MIYYEPFPIFALYAKNFASSLRPSRQCCRPIICQRQRFAPLPEDCLETLNIAGFELIYSNPKSPASVITEKLQEWGTTNLTDTIQKIPFTYTVDGFFQINIPIYEQALKDMKKWIDVKKPTVDLYSGVGTIGLTIGGKNVTLVEINERAVVEMKRNIKALDREKAVKAILGTQRNRA